MGKDLPPGAYPFGINRYDNALRPEVVAGLADQLRSFDCCGIDRDLIGTGLEQPVNIDDLPNSTTDGQWDEHLSGDCSDHVDSRVTLL